MESTGQIYKQEETIREVGELKQRRGYNSAEAEWAQVEEQGLKGLLRLENNQNVLGKEGIAGEQSKGSGGPGAAHMIPRRVRTFSQED